MTRLAAVLAGSGALLVLWATSWARVGVPMAVIGAVLLVGGLAVLVTEASPRWRAVSAGVAGVTVALVGFAAVTHAPFAARWSLVDQAFERERLDALRSGDCTARSWSLSDETLAPGFLGTNDVRGCVDAVVFYDNRVTGPQDGVIWWNGRSRDHLAQSIPGLELTSLGNDFYLFHADGAPLVEG